MAIEYYIVSREKRGAYLLGTGWWGVDLADITLRKLAAHVFDVLCGYSHMTPDEFAARRQDSQFEPERWVLDAERGFYLLRTAWFPQTTPTDEQVRDAARRDRAYAKLLAADIWLFAEACAWTKLEIVSDADDLPWWDQSGWDLRGSRYDLINFQREPL